MLTTCPECQTTFRVTQEHLGLRRGLVRCGHCGVVFNAYDSLLAELVAPPAELDKPARETITHPPVNTREPAEPVAIQDVPELAVEPHTPEPEPPTELPSEVPKPEPEPSLKVGGTRASPDTSEETSESILLSELPTRIRAAASARHPRSTLKGLALILLGLLLLLQLVLFLRATLVTALPSTRPFLQTLCRPLGCVVPLPRQLDKRAIAASSLEHDAENKSRARLSLLLANRGDQAQTWPHIVLILTDVRDAPVAQRIFAPEEYLAKGTRLETGMAPGEEQEIRLDLDTGTLAATGYALDLAYR